MELEKVQPAKPAPVDPAQYVPIQGRPGWSINGRGQMAKQGTLPPTPLADLFKGLVQKP